MDQVHQRGKCDSSIACIAMLTGATYEDASRFMREMREHKNLSGISTGYVLKAIRHFGREPKTERAQQFNGLELRHLSRDALLFAYRFDGTTRCSHYAVWDHQAQAVRDPYAGSHELTPRSFVLVD